MTETVDTYTAGSHLPLDTAEGRVLAPGAQATDVDPEHPHNARLIERGLLVRNAAKAEPTRDDLLAKAEALGISGVKSKNKEQIAQAIEDHNAAVTAEGDE